MFCTQHILFPGQYIPYPNLLFFKVKAKLHNNIIRMT